MSDRALPLLAVVASIDDVIKIVNGIDPIRLSGRDQAKLMTAAKDLREARAFIYSESLREKGL